jgi:hypothetical protein
MKRFNPSSRREEGSALMFALLALVFLTVIGLSLAVVTETEMMIGSNEQISQETFYAAEAGIAAAISRLMITNSMTSDYFFIPVKDGENNVTVGAKTLGYVVDFNSIYPVAWEPAPWSKANGDDPLLSVFFHLDVRARRMAWDTVDPGPDCQGLINPGSTPSSSSGDNPFSQIQAEKRLSLGFFASPLKGLNPSTMYSAFDKPDIYGCSENTSGL